MPYYKIGVGLHLEVHKGCPNTTVFPQVGSGSQTVPTSI